MRHGDGDLPSRGIDDWQAMVDSVMIDTSYDGEMFDISLTDPRAEDRPRCRHVRAARTEGGNDLCRQDHRDARGRGSPRSDGLRDPKVLPEMRWIVAADGLLDFLRERERARTPRPVASE